MNKQKLSIHSENILPIIKKWLYSDKDIFLRELVSNATDAISKLNILQSKNLAPKEEEFKIDISIDKEKKTLTIADTGIGMTKEEVEKYIAQIAFSGAEEFLEKYKTEDEKDQIIGHFGLGFYSAYMVAKKVEIKTKSYLDKDSATFWSCDGSSEYEISTSDKKSTGTEITLHIDDENLEFLEEDKVKSILNKYCPFLTYPIYLNGTHLNNKEPLWLKPASECSEKEYLEFYRELYPFEPDPIFWIHLNVDYPFHLKGILYFPKVASNFDMNKNSIKLFCSRVFVSDNCKDLLKDYQMVLRGAIDSTDIPLNVSRSYLQMDSTVRKLSSHISKKICDKLYNLYTASRDKFLSFWKDIELIIKLGILQDEKFYEKAKNFLVFETLEKSWTTIEEYLERNKEKSDKIFYTNDEHSPLLSIYREKNIEVLITNSYIDVALLNHLEAKLSTKFLRIDSNLDSAILDSSKEKTLLDSSGKSEATNIAAFFKEALSIEELEVEAKSLTSSDIPAFIMLKEEERRMRDYMNLTQKEFKFPTKQTLVINTNSPLVNKALSLKSTHLDLAKDLIKQIYNLSLLSQKELEPAKLSEFITHSTKVLEDLVSLKD